MSTSPDTPKILHVWTVTIDREVDETTTGVVNGQTVPVTHKVKKPVPTRMALRALTRKEFRDASRWEAGRTAFYVKDYGLLLASELTNRLINTSGGVLSEKEKARIAELRAKAVALEADLVRSMNATEDDKRKIQNELAGVRAELINLNAINEAVYNQTAEAMAQKDLQNWITFHTILIERAGKWVPFFEGDTFDAKEAFMWSLEESKDEFYTAAVQKISLFVYWYNRGVDTAEGFKLMEEEMEKQLEARKKEEAEKAAKAAAEKATAEAAAAQVTETPSVATSEASAAPPVQAA